MEKDLNNIDDYLLGKWINQDLNSEEDEKVKQWAESSTENAKFYKDIERIKGDIDELQLMSSINSTRGILNVKEKIKGLRGRSLSNFISWGQKIAAIIVIPLLVYTLYNVSSQYFFSNDKLVWQEVYTPVGLRSKYKLPDGTMVWLNGNTRLKYPLKFSKKERLVKLEGEAYFDVTSDKTHPFVVNTGVFSVQAVGTEFNVRALKGDDMVETALVEGKVNLLKETSKGVRKITSLKPNQIALYDDKNNDLKIRSTNLDKYVAWMESKILFRGDPLPDVLKRLGQWYHVDFEITDIIKSRNYIYTGSFEDEGLHQILECIELTTPVKFTFSPIKQNQDSTYVKRRIKVSTKEN